MITSTKLGLNLVDVAATKLEKDGAATNNIMKTNNEWNILLLADLPYPCN